MIVPNGAILFLFVVIEFPSVHMQGDVSQKEMKNYYLCYGSTYADLTKASCDGNSRIVMKDILLGAKLKSSSCQPESSSNLNQSEYERCCSLSQNDCTGRMVNLARNYSSGDFYLACMGKSKCSHRQTPRSPTADTHCVNETDHLKYTNYMYFEYKCIQASRIGKLPWVDLSWQPHNLYLQYSDYENPASETQVPCVVCSVETSIGSVINITRLHIELAKHNAVCNQTITVIEQFNIKHIISCKDNSADNKFNLTTLYTSESNKIELVYNGEAFSKGNFWLEFTASPTGRLKITCPVESNTTICNPLKPTQKSISATDSKTKTSTIILAVVGSIVGVFVIIAIWKCTRKQKHKDKQKESPRGQAKGKLK